jgi:hypothetical protein
MPPLHMTMDSEGKITEIEYIPEAEDAKKQKQLTKRAAMLEMCRDLRKVVKSFRNPEDSKFIDQIDRFLDRNI